MKLNHVKLFILQNNTYAVMYRALKDYPDKKYGWSKEK